MATMQPLRRVVAAFLAAVGRLDKSLSPSDTLNRFRQHKWTPGDAIYIFHITLATFWLFVMGAPILLKLAIPILYVTALLIPFTSQFFLPAGPIFLYLLSFFSSKYIPKEYRPTPSVVLLPTLESVLYGANVSDILTRFTHPILDLLAWVPYGVGHYIIPFIVAAFIWLFRPKEALHFWASAFGYMNLTGVLIQLVFPCAAPWYELIYGLTPADYTIRGSPGGLARIDRLFHSNGYTAAFSNSPLVFGAFPSLHAGAATMEALFISHFFPQTTKYVFSYAAVLYWATMYLTHHYLVDVVGGSCLAVAFFYLMLPEELKGANATAPPGGLNTASYRSKYEVYDLEEPRGRGRGSALMRDAEAYDLEELSDRESDEEMDITFRSPVVPDQPASAVPLIKSANGRASPVKKSHRHTASIASLIRSEDRGEEGWSPIGGSFAFPPPTPTRAQAATEEGKGARAS
ncbi:PAP2-domain-containing protein [Trametes versicolor FP-101664 SS1]|uniref:PAP2-domain-containing protein n=1 Tax=Trametes versicolor (strain FP-101664) TaxID=717944 RepID=UPI0004622002|nr:PAP2-domain-containing protein [Trametes versicolor FP-101664 SS1]EIW52957.1 PAP2-domain-containing protein [Trametes versicolor FP-101664 SS1]